MAEYYPLLAKAVGTLPNSTPETRRVVYERARKALIGQLRTLHPPVADADIEHESTELDRAIARVEAELAPGATNDGEAKPIAAPVKSDPPPFAPAKPVAPPPAVTDKPFPQLRTKVPGPKPSVPAQTPPVNAPPVASPAVTAPSDGAPPVVVPPVVDQAAVASDSVSPDPVAGERKVPIVPRLPVAETAASVKQTKIESQRPIAPQPPVAKGPKRPLWVIPACVGLVVVVVAVAAWKLRDRPETVARAKPAEQTQTEAGKIAERVGGGANQASSDAPSSDRAASATSPKSSTAPRATQTAAQPTAAAGNPELPVAHRAALLVEAPNEESKVKTYLGTVVWKLNTVNEGQADAASLAVEADVDLPDDKMKAVVTFQKNTDASLPASHTIKVRFMIQPGSPTGDVKQINVPQMRREDSPSGDALAGVTVPIVQNSFLVGLSPGNAETANLEMLRSMQWIDIPMLLDSGKIAKLTFEKSDSGERDLTEAIAAWQK